MRISSPRTIVDVHGRIIAWVIPDAFTKSEQVCIRYSTGAISYTEGHIITGLSLLSWTAFE